MNSGWCVYILSNHAHTTYVGSTSDLLRRMREHRNHTFPSAFTAQWTFNRLVYYEFVADEASARSREAQIKRWRREKKVALIQRMNPNWADLTPDIGALFR
jgi:putative endonuclease